jgi:hypothetical protein
MESFKEFLFSKKDKVKKEEPVKEIATEEVETVVESIKEEDHKIDIVEEKIEDAIEESSIEESIQEAVQDIVEGYKIFRDKSENFICDMEITGADPQKSKARIIVESKDLTYMFEGTIDGKGQCRIPLKKMNFLNENETGTIKLEIIAEDMVFVPWSDTFTAVSSKKVQVKNISESEDLTTKVGIKITRIK